MENIITVIIALLTSGIISAIISTISNSRIKAKELEAKLKLEEKNKWIENINQAHGEYMDSTTKYLHGLIQYSVKRLNSSEISNRLGSINKAHNSLIYYIYQSEYTLSLVEEVEQIMNTITDNFNDQRKVTVTYKKFLAASYEGGEKKELEEMIGEFEDKLGENNYKISEKLGKMVREEKQKMTNEIIKRK